ncbi:unnamed protein product [Prunus armeniaca]
MLSHYVDDLEGHDRIKSALDHIGTHALLKMLAPASLLSTPEGDPVHPAECMQQLLEKVWRHRVNVDGNV